jgi:hypothetical protein
MRHGNRQGRRGAGNKASDPEIERLGVPAKVAFVIIGCGTTYGYGLLKSGELESYYLGRARRVTMRSIRRCVERRVANAAQAKRDIADAPEPQNATGARRP